MILIVPEGVNKQEYIASRSPMTGILKGGPAQWPSEIPPDEGGLFGGSFGWSDLFAPGSSRAGKTIAHALGRPGRVFAPVFTDETYKSLLTGAGHDVYKAIKEGGGIEEIVPRAIDPGNIVQDSTRALGEEATPKEIRPHAPKIGATVGGVLYGPGGAAAGAKIGTDIKGGSQKEALLNAGMAAAMAYAMGSEGVMLQEPSYGTIQGEVYDPYFEEGGLLGGEEGILGAGGNVTPPPEGSADVSDFEAYKAEAGIGPGEPAKAAGEGILSLENAKSVVSLASSAYNLLQDTKAPDLPEVPAEAEYPAGWENWSDAQRQAWLLVRGGQAAKKGKRYAGELKQIRGGEYEDIGLQKGILSGHGRAAKS